MGPTNDRIMLVSSLGGTPRELPVKHGVSNRALWLPDGKRLLFLGMGSGSTGQGTDWYTVTVEGGIEASSGATQWLPDAFSRVSPQSISSDGVLIYIGQGDSANVYRVPFDVSAGRITGAPIPVTMAPGVNFWPSASSDGTKIAFGNA